MKYKDFEVSFDIKQAEYKVEGYAAIKNNIDSSKERIKDGAFSKTIRERFPKKLIKMFWWHREPMGLPIHIEEDSKGLYTVSQVSKTPSNEERLVLMKDGVVDRMSIGYDVIKDNADGDIRDLLELKLYEYSPVPIAANEETYIIDVKDLDGVLTNFYTKLDIQTKKATAFSNLPLADRQASWDANAAVGRVRKWAGGPNKEDVDWGKYAKAFLWYDAEDAESYGAYKLPFADVIGGTLKAVPKGIFAAAAAIQGARGGVDIPSSDVAGVKAHIEKYYAKMREEFEDDNITAPWKSNEDIELKEGRILSSSNRQKIAEVVTILQELLDLTNPEKDDVKMAYDLMDELKKIKAKVLLN